MKKAKRNSKLQRHMKSHYRTRDTISQIRLKQVNERLKEAQMKLKENDSLELLVEASLVVYPISFRCQRTNFEGFGEILVFFMIFGRILEISHCRRVTNTYDFFFGGIQMVISLHGWMHFDWYIIYQ